jgi:hypothetical protein
MTAELIECVSGWQPCSFSIVGNLILVGLYGIVLAYSAKMISDGSELLLDLGFPAAIIGGVVLPLLGAVPDSAMIIASGVGGSREEVQKEINVGMGTLAGSTIMLLTIPWLGGIILGRVDIVNKEGIDKKCSRFSIKSFWKQGVSVFPDVTRGAIVMLITTLPYFIVQGADWYYGPTRPNTSEANGEVPTYIKYTSLSTGIICFILFVAYLVYQIVDSVAARRKAEVKRKELIQRRVIRQIYLIQKKSFEKINVPRAAEGTSSEKTPLVDAEANEQKLGKKYFGAWKMSKGLKKAEAETKPDETEVEKSGEEDEEKEEPKWMIALKSILLLTFGVGFVTLFSDPMAGALTAITDPTRSGIYGNYIPIPTFYVSFIVTPLCSNASELISSLVFASKKRKMNSSMTFSQLYGAATMNNTLGLGIFAILVYAQGLYWEYSAEVTVIILIQFTVGLIAVLSGFLYNHTYILGLGFLVGSLYIVSLALVAILENVANWK